MKGESFYKPTAVLEAMRDKAMPGGCDDCDAFQTVEAVGRGVYVLTVHHDDTCPTLRAMTGEGE